MLTIDEADFCPFCGSNTLFVTPYKHTVQGKKTYTCRISCDDCGASLHPVIQPCCENEEKAIDFVVRKWNERKITRQQEKEFRLRERLRRKNKEKGCIFKSNQED